MLTTRKNFNEFQEVDKALESFRESIEDFETLEQRTEIKRETTTLKKQFNLANDITRAFKKDLRNFKHSIDREYATSAAMCGLEESLLEFVKNAIDCKANYLEINIQITPEENSIQITVNDDGNQFPAKFFPPQTSQINYYETILENGEKTKILSTKAIGDSLGGYGLGLGLCATFLHNHDGSLFLSNTSPKIKLVSSYNKTQRSLQQNFNILRESHGSVKLTSKQVSSISEEKFNKRKGLRIEIEPQSASRSKKLSLSLTPQVKTKIPLRVSLSSSSLFLSVKPDESQTIDSSASTTPSPSVSLRKLSIDR